MNKYVKFWLRTAITRAPYEMQSILQDYIEEPAPREAAIHLAEDDMGRSVALDLVRILPSNGREASLPAWGGWKADNSARFARSLASRSFFDGSQTTAAKLAVELDTLLQEHAASGHAKAKKVQDLRSPLYRCAAFLVKSKHVRSTFVGTLLLTRLGSLTLACCTHSSRFPSPYSRTPRCPLRKRSGLGLPTRALILKSAS